MVCAQGQGRHCATHTLTHKIINKKNVYGNAFGWLIVGICHILGHACETANGQKQQQQQNQTNNLTKNKQQQNRKQKQSNNKLSHTRE